MLPCFGSLSFVCPVEREILQKLLEKKSITPVATFPGIETILMGSEEYPKYIVVINGRDFTAVPSNVNPVSDFWEHKYPHDL